MKRTFRQGLYLACTLFGAGLFLAVPIRVRAEIAGPGWIHATADPVSPEAADSYYWQKAAGLFEAPQVAAGISVPLLASFSPGTTSSATAATPEITELARALQYDPKLIYDYVHNHIEYAPYFGSLKGATLTYYDGVANDVDQASLMIALLRESGYTANYQYGLMTLAFGPDSALCQWMGSSNNCAKVLATAGIPFQMDVACTQAQVNRVWVSASIEGTDYVFDPAFKAYTRTPQINLAEAMGYYRDALFDIGGTITADYAQNVSEADLDATLTDYASNLVATIRTNYPNQSVSEILGRRQIVQSELREYSTSLPDSTSLIATWQDVPAELAATIRIQHQGIDYTLFTSALAGQRLTVRYVGSNNHPELRLGDNILASGTATTPGTRYALILTIDHPFAADNGTYGDQTATYDMLSGGTYALITDFGGTAEALVAKHQQQLVSYQAAGLSATSEAVLGETLDIMGLMYMQQNNLANRLWQDITDTVVIVQHFLGRMSQEKSYHIDLGQRYDASISNDKNESYLNSFYRYTRFSGFGSALEAGVLEQAVGGTIPAVSTVHTLGIANATGHKIYLADSSNFASVRPRLLNYPTAVLDLLQSDVRSGSPWVMLPDNGQIAVGPQWRGYAYYEPSGAKQGGWFISGNLHGGDSSTNGPINTSIFQTFTNISVVPPFEVEKSDSVTRDPIDMATGAFLLNHTDLALGGISPRGLSFSRAYNSSLNLQNGPLGFGWSHNSDVHLQQISHPSLGLGAGQPVDAAALIVAVYTVFDLPPALKDFKSELVAVLVNKWAMDRLINNVMALHIGNHVAEYVKLADGSYAPPPGETGQLIANNNGTFTLQERFGTHLDFDSSNRISSLTDVDGNTATFTYGTKGLTQIQDTFGHTLSIGSSCPIIGIPENPCTTPRIGSVSDSAGRTVRYAYDTAGNLSKYTDPDGKVWSYGYDSAHRLTSLTDPLGNTTATNGYDSLGRVATQTVPRQGGLNATYNLYFSGFRNAEQDPDGHQMVYFFDDNGNQVGQQDALGNRSTRTYDAQHHAITLSDPRGNTTTDAYDGQQNLRAVIDPQGDIARSVYDSQFQLTDVVDPLGHRTRLDYDATHHLIGSIDAVGNQTAASYFPTGLPQTRTDARGTTTALTYDSNGNPLSSRIGSHSPIVYNYDQIGRLTTLTDQLGSTSTFAYNQRSLPTTKMDALGQGTFFSYDAAGQLASVTDRNGQKTGYAYTPSGKLQTITLADSSTITFTYDQLDNRVSMQDSIGLTAYAYDGANRLISVTNPFGFTVSYAYDEVGNVVQLTYPGDKTVAYTYDALNRLSTVTNWLSQQAVYSYDEAGRVTSFVNFNGSVTTYGHDDASRLTRVENRKSDGSSIATYAITLDGNGNRTGIIQNEPALPVTTSSSAAYSYNTQGNRLQAAGGTTFSWDQEGQLLAGRGSSNVSFDSLHRLVQVNGLSSLQYAYDGAGQRLQAVRDGVTTRYIYDAGGSLIAEADGSNVITRYYVYGAGLIAMITPGGDTYSYHFNAVGSTAAVSDTSGNIVDAYAYSPFGEMAGEVEAVSQPFKFVGRYGVFAEPGGLYYMRARYYDAVVGRFISEDPKGVAADDLNSYAYTANNPATRVDPSGLTSSYGAVTLIVTGVFLAPTAVVLAIGVVETAPIAIAAYSAAAPIAIAAYSGAGGYLFSHPETFETLEFGRAILTPEGETGVGPQGAGEQAALFTSFAKEVSDSIFEFQVSKGR